MGKTATPEAESGRPSPWPAADGRRVLFLVDARNGFERSLVEQWIHGSLEAATTADREWHLLPIRRKRRGGRVIPDDLPQFLDDGEDTWLAPVRVAWFARSRGTKKGVRPADLIWGDPRNPGRVLRRWIHAKDDGRCRLIVAESATTATLRARHARSRQSEHASFADYVVRQAVLALERAERRARGTRYKVPRLVEEDILARSSLQQELAKLAAAGGKTTASMNREARSYLREMAAAHRKLYVDLFARFSRFMYSRGFDSRLVYDAGNLASIRDATLTQPVVFLFTHKSYLDVPVLVRLFYDRDFPPAHLFGGINMNIFGLGALMRGAGLVFIRRSFQDNAVYKLVFQHYIDYLVEKRFPLMWAIEGTRSRSGKLLAPRLGLLSYVVEAARRTDARNLKLVPVSIAYDQIPEVGEYSAEQRGGVKKAEDVNWLMRYLTSLKSPFGRVYVCFGEPVALTDDASAVMPAKASDRDAHQLLVQKAAFQVSDHINRVTPVTATALVTLALLGAGQRALTLREVGAEVDELLDWVRHRQLPTTNDVRLDNLDGVERTLLALAENGVVAGYEGGPDTVYSIGPEQALNAAYYRNTIIHFFVNDALGELGLLRSQPNAGQTPEAVFRQEVLALRDLLKFEFYYAAKPEFCDQVAMSLTMRDAAWANGLHQPAPALACLARMRPLLAHAVLRSIIDAYVVVANVLLSYDARPANDDKQFIKECLALGKQMHLQRRIESEESIARAQYASGWKLVCNRGLATTSAGDLAEARVDFALQLRELSHDIDVIRSIAASRRIKE